MPFISLKINVQASYAQIMPSYLERGTFIWEGCNLPLFKKCALKRLRPFYCTESFEG